MDQVKGKRKWRAGGNLVGPQHYNPVRQNVVCPYNEIMEQGLQSFTGNRKEAWSDQSHPM